MTDAAASIALNGAPNDAANADMSLTVSRPIDAIQQQFELFLTEYTVDGASEPFYGAQLDEMIATGSTTLYVDYQHLSAWSQSSVSDLLTHVMLQWAVREEFLCAAVRAVMSARAPTAPLAKTFSVAVFNLPIHSNIRSLRASQVGELQCVIGTVTRTSPVRPELLLAAFTCADCTATNGPIAQQYKYTEPIRCVNLNCPNRTKWTLDFHKSSFTDWQAIKVQENANDIPPGSMPRTLKVVLRNESVELCKPGDKVLLTGCVVAVPDVSQLKMSGGVSKIISRDRSATEIARGNAGMGVTGLKELGVRELSHSLVFIACTVQTRESPRGLTHSTVSDPRGVAGESLAEVMSSLSSEERNLIDRMRQTPHLLTRLCQSFAPSVFGHNDIKRGLMLQLLGGVHKRTPDGASLRGDINVCIVGDPSTSKSQFLKYICTFLPRAVYTSGKASSAAGLTASVVRDVETGEYGIEAGALMLADHSICCIDEFDKMEITDQVAIHEAMEQQTISITKAGIQATLNARTSVLAAANPIRGRYDRTRTLSQNIDISAPIMSRFDLFFVVVDECNEAVDHALARHIVNVHAIQSRRALDNSGAARDADIPLLNELTPMFTMADLQLYIRVARAYQPTLSDAARKTLMLEYVALRAADSTGVNKQAYRMTVRQLESLIRLSEAYARLYMTDSVQDKHARLAVELLKKSIIRVESADVTLEQDEDDEVPAPPQQPQRAANGVVSIPPTAVDAAESVDAPVADVPKRVIELDRAEYRRIMLLLIRRLRDNETAHPDRPALSQSELVHWYIEQTLDDMSDESDIEYAVRLLKLVITRMIKVDGVLIAESRKVKGSKADPMERKLTVHPNFDDGAGLIQDVNAQTTPAATPQTATSTSESAATAVTSSSSPALDEESPRAQSKRRRITQPPAPATAIDTEAETQADDDMTD